jgi:hypothetical protein
MIDMKSPFSMLGWKFKKSKEDEKVLAPFVQPANEDASYVIGSGYFGYNVHQLNMDQTFNNEVDLIRKYREISIQPEPDAAITNICNEAICGDNEGAPISIRLDAVQYPDTIKDKIKTEFETIIKLLNFNKEAYEIFRKWYVDGRLYYHIIIDEKNPKNGIKELRQISPIQIRKIREEETEIGPGGIEYVKSYNEYYLYNKDFMKNKYAGIRLTTDSVSYVHSGIVDENVNMVYGWIHKSMKPSNQLRMMEDAIVIYRISRAPERRIFYVDVGNLPRHRAEEYLRNMKTMYNNKITYDVVTGELKDTSHTMSMMEDYWIPRREGGKATEIDTLRGGENLDQIADVEYFRKRLFNSLNVPIARISGDEGTGLGFGRASEISRDEINFSKFISRLRKRFSYLFYDILKTQLLLKNIITEKDWEVLKEQISFSFLTDNHIKESQESEVLLARAGIVETLRPMIGEFLSKEYVWKEVLKMTDDDIKNMKKQIKKEIAAGEITPQDVGPEEETIDSIDKTFQS